MPGPLPLVKARPFVVAAPPGGYGDDEDVDDVELDFVHLEYAQGIRGARTPDASHYDPLTLLDSDGVAAGVVLRDVHAALIKVRGCEGHAWQQGHACMLMTGMCGPAWRERGGGGRSVKWIRYTIQHRKL